MYFPLWKQALEQDYWKSSMGSIVQKPWWLPKTWAKVIWLSLCSHPKRKNPPNSEHLKHFEVVTMSVSNRCPWDSKSESRAHQCFLTTLQKRSWKKPTVRHKHFHLTFIFNQGVACGTILCSRLRLNTLLHKPMTTSHITASVPLRLYSRSLKVGRFNLRKFSFSLC